MKPLQISKSALIFLWILTGLSICQAQSVEGQDDESQFVVSRNASTQSHLNFNLKKNVFRKEPYQTNYEVQVPYQETETYTVQVPYNVSIPYQDIEYYTTTEYRCGWGLSYQSNNFAAMANFTHDEHGGFDGGRHGDEHRGEGWGGGDRDGDDHHGGGGGWGGPRPYPPCGYVLVTRARYVTRYRTETRYNTEQRTRQVTKYKTETRCCETKYKDVFDHSYSFSISLKLPSVELFPSEVEQIKFSLGGSESAPTFNLDTQASIYPYVISKQEVTGASVYLELSADPKYDSKNAGNSSISPVEIKTINGFSTLKIIDPIVGAHVQSSYIIKVTDTQHTPLAEGSTTSNGSTEILIPLNKNLQGKGPAVVEIKVIRTGSFIKNGSLSFSLFKGFVL